VRSEGSVNHVYSEVVHMQRNKITRRVFALGEAT